jgi:hypothetical protein
MPTVPGTGEYMAALDAQEQQKRPTPERLLMTAADMHARGQLTEAPTSFSSKGADLKLPFAGGGRGSRPSGTHGKRR